MSLCTDYSVASVAGFCKRHLSAAGETRTLIPLREPAPKAGVSTNFTTAAKTFVFNHIKTKKTRRPF